jgi:hypothetical protein
VLAEGKTLAGAMGAVEAAARKQGSRAVMRDAEIFDAVDGYFNIAFDLDARIESKRAVDGEDPSLSAPLATGGRREAPGGFTKEGMGRAAVDLDFDSFL